MAKNNRSTKRIISDNRGAQVLFANAKGLVDEILFMIDQYNEIATALDRLGYGTEGGPSNFDANPVPSLGLFGTGCGNMVIWDSDFLTEFWEAGPAKKITTIIRMPLAKERERLGKESHWTCFYCTKQGDEDFGPDERVWHVDHPYPVIRGGDDMPDNHVLSCATCNAEKRATTAMEYFGKLLGKERLRVLELQTELEHFRPREGSEVPID